MSLISTVLLALGLVLIIEGLAYALAPSYVERMLIALRDLPEQARRLLGALVLVIGIILVGLAKVIGG